MRQMQMLLFARFGVCPSQSLALASLTNHPVVVWKRQNKAENFNLVACA